MSMLNLLGKEVLLLQFLFLREPPFWLVKSLFVAGEILCVPWQFLFTGLAPDGGLMVRQMIRTGFCRI